MQVGLLIVMRYYEVAKLYRGKIFKIKVLTDDKFKESLSSNK